ncbi:MAG: DNA-directed RNA polymerase subunit beta' [Bacteroidetes bacterium]|nr:DNA-directed RNA polymerase subunit beta' [Bacteroidota bacterium]
MNYTPTQQFKKDFRQISISLASPEAILSRSHGEVLKPETINYRTFRPEKDGLFCEKIFGPIKDWECHCGKYKRIRYKGIICDRCGVEVTQKSVRRERMGHISLAVPVVHIWYFRSLPNKIGYILGLSTKELEKVIYYENYVVINQGASSVAKNTLLTEEQYFEVLDSLPSSNFDLNDHDPNKFVAKMGGDAVEHLLAEVDIEKLAAELRSQALTETSSQRKAEALKRLKVVEAFRPADTKPENKPEWMVMKVVPVIPPELRPLVPLEGGRFATSDLNDLYRRVIIRNNRLKRLIDIKAPEVILRNEKRMLQEAVDSLLDNSRKSNAVRADGNRALKSLSDMLKGKQGRFRQNLLGKRVDYSGRSVIVVGPELKLHECGLPKDMGVELFKPFVIRKLIERGYVKTVKSAKKLVERKGPEVWDILEKVIDGHPILLNRAPTLHRLGIQAFQPKLIEGKAIQLHPLVCTAFNADFDGDQMAVHIPLSYEAQLEAQLLMLSSHNILSPASGAPILVPSQDIILGIYYITKSRKGDRGEGMAFSSYPEVVAALDNKVVSLHAIVQFRYKGQRITTTPGRVLFNHILPEEMGYINEVVNKKKVISIISESYRKAGALKTAYFLDNLKDLGFRHAMMGGLSISLDDIIIPEDKESIIEKTQKLVFEFEEQYQNGFITNSERYNKVIDEWSRATNQVAGSLFNKLSVHRDGFNSVYMMADSGARGSRDQIRQLAGMRGLMQKPQKSMSGGVGEIIENPIISNFHEGLSVLEYFISTHGARKGLADTALKTADAGYLTRRLVDVAQDEIITSYDCGTVHGLNVIALKDGEDIVEPLSDRALGRVALNDVYDPITNELLIASGTLIDEELAEKINQSALESIMIRSVLTCEMPRGVCALCYGRNLATGKLVEIGEAVGVIAAQSIGEPGTQLTLRTFHIGGAASRITDSSLIKAKFEGKIEFENLRKVLYDNGEEEILIAISRNGVIHIKDDVGHTLTRYTVPYGAKIRVNENDRVVKEQPIFEWDPYNAVIISEFDGRVVFKDIKMGVTAKEEADEQTGHVEIVITDSKDRTLSPSILIFQGDTLKATYHIPVRAHLTVQDGMNAISGQIIAKMPRESSKTKDITGGLPRVTELFEARNPQDPATIAEIDGLISFGTTRRGSREVIITSPETEEQRKYLIPISKHILLQEGDHVFSGDRITDGAISPADILRIKGPNAVQEYLVNEIQAVYRLQGVKINDKHIETIVRPMLQKVNVEDPGDTMFLEGDQIDRIRLEEENAALLDKVVVLEPGDSKLLEGQLITKKKLREVNLDMKRKGKTEIQYRDAHPATSQPVLLGITSASLSTESFFSAASFQETTKVLTDAAIAGKRDDLLGLKENIIVGHLIPAGTGLRAYQSLALGPKPEEPAEAETEAANEAGSGDKPVS